MGAGSANTPQRRRRNRGSVVDHHANVKLTVERAFTPVGKATVHAAETFTLRGDSRSR